MLNPTDEKFTYESVVLRRVTEYMYEPFAPLLARQRNAGLVLVVTIANLEEVMNFGMRGLEDVSKFIGDFVFDFFPDSTMRSYLAWSTPVMFVPFGAEADVQPVVNDIRQWLARGRLELAPRRHLQVSIATGVSKYNGSREKTISQALTAVNIDLQRYSRIEQIVTVMGEDWIPHFAADYMS